MSENVLSFIIAHGNIAESLADATKHLTKESVKMITYSNSVKSLDDLIEEISDVINENNPEKLVFFIDLIGGSCWMAANRIQRKFPQAELISGVNLAMLVSFQINYNNLKWADLMEKIVLDGKKGITHR
jgi:mannose/fructose-specific phosphotransferase system component IIA